MTSNKESLKQLVRADALFSVPKPRNLQKIFDLIVTTSKTDKIGVTEDIKVLLEVGLTKYSPTEFAINVLENLQFISKHRNDIVSECIIEAAIELLDRPVIAFISPSPLQAQQPSNTRETTKTESPIASYISGDTQVAGSAQHPADLSQSAPHNLNRHLDGKPSTISPVADPNIPTCYSYGPDGSKKKYIFSAAEQKKNGVVVSPEKKENFELALIEAQAQKSKDGDRKSSKPSSSAAVKNIKVEESKSQSKKPRKDSEKMDYLEVSKTPELDWITESSNDRDHAEDHQEDDEMEEVGDQAKSSKKSGSADDWNAKDPVKEAAIEKLLTESEDLLNKITLNRKKRRTITNALRLIEKPTRQDLKEILKNILTTEATPEEKQKLKEKRLRWEAKTAEKDSKKVEKKPAQSTKPAEKQTIVPMEKTIPQSEAPTIQPSNVCFILTSRKGRRAPPKNQWQTAVLSHLQTNKTMKPQLKIVNTLDWSHSSILPINSSISAGQREEPSCRKLSAT